MRNMDVLMGSRLARNLPSWILNSLMVNSSVAFWVYWGGTLKTRVPPFWVWTANMLSETYVQSPKNGQLGTDAHLTMAISE